MNFRSLFAYVFCLFILPIISFGQLDQVHFAKTYVHSGKHEKAIKKFEKIGNSHGYNTELLLLLAETNLEIGNSLEAQKWYARAIENPSIDPNLILKYVDLLRFNNEEDKALEVLEAYQDYDESIFDYWEELKRFEGIIDAEITVHAITELNTEFSDEVITTYHNNELLTRQQGKSRGKREGRFTLLQSKLNEDFSINKYPEKRKSFAKSYHAGRVSFSESGIFAVAGLEHNKRKGSKNNILVWSLSNSSGSYSNWQELFPKEKLFYDDVDPTISSDGTTIFFASNRPGGFGGYDIYESNLIDGIWQEPHNMGPSVNTAGDERYPFFHQNAYLYFSSNGRLAYGGFDIFKVNLMSNKLEYELLPVPINSNRDDYAYTLLSDNAFLFSSNRINGKGSADIYGARLTEVDNAQQLIFQVSNNESISIPNASVSVTNVKTGVEHLYQSDAKGLFSHFLIDGNQLRLRVTHPSYLRLEEEIQIDGQTKPINIVLQEKSNEGWTILTNLKFGIGSSKISDISASGLSDVLRILVDHPELRIAFRGHTDAQGDAELNLTVSERRLEAVKDYLRKESVSTARIDLYPMGESALLNDCADGVKCTELEHALNRRIDYRFLGEKNVVDQVNAKLATELVQYKIQIGAFSHPESIDRKKLEKIGVFTLEPLPNGVTRVLIGEFENITDAKEALLRIQDMGFKDAYVQKYKGGQRSE